MRIFACSLSALVLFGCGSASDVDSAPPRPARSNGPLVTMSPLLLEDDAPKAILDISDDGLSSFANAEGRFSLRCPRRVVGTCAVVACDNASPHRLWVPDAGHIILNGARIGAPGRSLRWHEYAYGDNVLAPLRVEDPVLRVRAEGGYDFPAFELSLARPEAVTFLGTLDGLQWGQPPTQDVVLRWSGGVGDSTETSWLSALYRGAHPSNVGRDAPWVECRWPPAAGEGTIPLELLREVSAPGYAYLYVASVTAIKVTPVVPAPDSEPFVIRITRPLARSTNSR